MCTKSSSIAIILIVVLNLIGFHQICSAPLTSASLIREALVQVLSGETVTLICESNDENHSFIYWYINERDLVIGPGNTYYDIGKFRYEVLSGNLTVKAVSKQEEGVYNCVSRGLKTDDVNIRSVRMVVQSEWEEVYVEDSNVNLFRVVIVLGSLMILSGVSYAGYKVWKTRHQHTGYLVPSDDEDEDSTEELFRAPNTPRGKDNIIKTNSTDSFETPGISTDFKSILDTASNK